MRNEQRRRAAGRRGENHSRTLRVIAGELKGRELVTPNLAGTHPMGSREKMALFNMVAGELPGARVLDAYAGSGALGIEALSRGAEFAVFVEKNRTVSHTIERNLRMLGLGTRSTVVVGAVADWAGKTKQRFNIILADPPYDKFGSADSAKLLSLLAPLLLPEGLLVLSHPAEASTAPLKASFGIISKMPPETLPEASNCLQLLKTRRYARASISVYRAQKG